MTPLLWFLMTIALIVIVCAVGDDPRWLRWARRRIAIRRGLILDKPSKDCRRDINCGSWS